MRRFFVIFVLPVCLMFMMSCKSGGKSEVEGVDMSGLYPPPVSDFLPDNCRPDPDTGTGVFNEKSKEITGEIKLYYDNKYTKSWRTMDYFVLPDTCKNPLATYNSTPTPGTVSIKVTDVINFPNDFHSVEKIREAAEERAEWCNPVDVDFYSLDRLGDDLRVVRAAAGRVCAEFISSLEEQERLSKEAQEFFKKNAGKWIVVQIYTRVSRSYPTPQGLDLYALAARVTDVRNGSQPKSEYKKWALNLYSTFIGFTFIKPKVEAQEGTQRIAEEINVEYEYQVQK